MTEEIAKAMIEAKKEIEMPKEELLNKLWDLQDRIDKTIKYIDDMCLCSSGYFDYGDDLSPKHIVDILKGEDND